MLEQWEIAQAKRNTDVENARKEILEIWEKEVLTLTEKNELIELQEISIETEERDDAPLVANNLVSRAQQWRDEELFLKAQGSSAELILLLPPEDWIMKYAASFSRKARLFTWRNPKSGLKCLKQIRSS